MASCPRLLPSTCTVPKRITSISGSPTSIPLAFQSLPLKPISFSLQPIGEFPAVNSKFKKQQFRKKASMAEKVSTEKSGGEVQVFDSEEDLAVAMAKYVAHLSDQFAKERGAFSVVFSGGSLIDLLRSIKLNPS